MDWPNVALVSFKIGIRMTFKLLDYPPKRSCCLSAMTYRSLFLERNDGGQEDPGGEGMVPVASDLGFFMGTLKPPAASDLLYATCGHN